MSRFGCGPASLPSGPSVSPWAADTCPGSLKVSSGRASVWVRRVHSQVTSSMFCFLNLSRLDPEVFSVVYLLFRGENEQLLV